MTKERVDELLYEVIPQQLFHVGKTDLDDEHGVRLDELTLINIIHNHPEILKYKSLKQLVSMYIDTIEV